MNWTRWTGAVAVTVTITAVVAVSCTTSSTTTSTPSTDPAAKVAHGRYLVTVMGCSDCHTPGTFYAVPDTTRLLSGSEIGWVGPWGVTYARNLTPDSTGLASWTEQDIVTSLRTGQRPDRSMIQPPMPWPWYAHLSDDDAGAIAAYLKSIPAVNHRVPDALPAGAKPTGSLIVFPPPPAWDGSHLPPAGSGAPASGSH